MHLNNIREKFKAKKWPFIVSILFTILSFFHLIYSFYTEHTQCYIRSGFCLLIALATFIFSRKGFVVTFLLYAYVLVYFNEFFNYTSFFYVLIAILFIPKVKIPAFVIYGIDIFVIFPVKHIQIMALGIHIVNCIIYAILFYIGLKLKDVILQKLIFSQPASVESIYELKLTDEERLVLSELAEGKLQKEIKEFSANKVTKLLRNAMERNGCKSKTELQQKFLMEKTQNAVIQSQNDVIESHVQSQGQSD